MIPTVLIVKEGQWGQATPDDYERQVKYLQETLEAEVPAPHGGMQKAADVEIFATAKEAEHRIQTGTGVSAVVFVTRDMEKVAEEMAARYPRMRVVVWTGFIPDGKVIWIGKHWAPGAEYLRAHILR